MLNGFKSFVFFFTLLLFGLTVGSAVAIDGIVAASLDYGFFDKWRNTQGEAMPMLSSAGTVAHKQNYTIYTLFSGYSVNADTIADVVMDVKIIAPSGKTYFGGTNVKVFNGKVMKPLHTLLSITNIEADFENDDELGTYKIFITLKDKIAKKQKELKTKITLSNFKRVDMAMSEMSEMSDWMQSYYISPDPLQALEVFLQMSAGELPESFYLPFNSFFIEVFNNNEFLIPELLELYATRQEIGKLTILYLLSYLNYDAKEFYSKLPSEEIEYVDYLKTMDNPFNDNEIESASHLDIQWTKFFASGAYDPILQLVNALQFSEFLPDLENYEKSDKSKEAALRANKGAWYTAAKWSLESNCSQYVLVKDYCRYILNNEPLSESVKKDLKLIIGD